MASGKQLSFSYGEVSETLRFRSNEVYYGNGLYRLRNGIVRKEGGVSNRSGFKFLADALLTPPAPFETPESCLMTVIDPNDGRKKAMVYTENDFSGAVGVNTPSYRVYDDEGNSVGSAFTSGLTDPWKSLGGSAKDAQVTQFENYTFLTFGSVDASEYRFPVVIRRFPSSFWTHTLFFQDFQSPLTGSESITKTVTKISGDPSFSSYYIVMAELEDGTEKYYYAFDYTEHPTSSTQVSFNLNNTYNGDDVVRYNIYRSAGTIDSAFGFVGSVKISDSTTTSFLFNDFVLAADILRSPPINPRLWATQYGGSFGATSFTGSWVMRDFIRSMVYQQRLFVAYDADASGFKEGTVGVSRLGSPFQFHMPNVYDNINAFEFKVPLVKGDKIVSMMGSERPLIFTKQEVMMLRGEGEEGVITPTGINPKTISEEGCSDSIQPVKTERGAVWVNYDHTKVMRITFSTSGEMTIEDLTSFSDHLIEQTITDIAYTRGAQDIVWVLRNDGKLVSITIGQAGYGFSLQETEGNIYSIATISTTYDYDRYGNFDTDIEFTKKETEGLAALIRREIGGGPTAKTYLEVIKPRDDQYSEGFNFADSYVQFGTRLTVNQDGVWTAKVANDGLPQQRPPISINKTLGTNYLANETCSLFAQTDLSSTVGAATYVDFYYDDEDGKQKTLRFVRKGSPVWDGGASLFYVNGYFLSDVPEALQNPRNAPSFSIVANYSNNLITTRYVIPTNIVTGLSYLEGREVSVFADNQVVSSPNNTHPSWELANAEITGGNCILPDYYGHGIIGLPYDFELETLPIEASDNRTYSDAKKSINAVGAAFYRTRGGFQGTEAAQYDVAKMTPIQYNQRIPVNDQDELYTGHAKNLVKGNWQDEGRVTIKQVDPLPITVLSVYPKGVAGG